MPERKSRPFSPLLTIALIVLPVLYAASFGPACWLLARSLCPASVITTGYAPVLSIAEYGPEPVRKVIWWWCGCCRSDYVLEDAIRWRIDSRKKGPIL